MRRCIWFARMIFTIAALLAAQSANGSITSGQSDDFQTLNTLGWTMGPNSPQFPFIVNTGGPLGANDAFLEAVSTGTGMANSKMIIFNSDQWTGNYLAAGVTRISTEMANFGSSPLAMRIGIQDNIGTEYGSTNAVALPADSQWHTVSFDMSPSALSLIQGSSSATQALSNVGLVRILSAANGPSFKGDTIAATLGVDDIAATPEPAIVAPFLLFAAMLCRRPPTRHGTL